MTEAYLRQSALAHLGLAGRAAAPSDGAPVSLTEMALPAAVNLRGGADDAAFHDAVREALSLDLPTAPNTVATAGDIALLWFGPDEWLAVRHDTAPDGEAQLAARLRAGLTGRHAAVTDVGESLVCLRIAGPMARDVIAKGCPLDLHPSVFGGAGHCAQSHLSKTAIVLHQRDEAPTFDLYTRRSFADYLWHWLEDAAREYAAG